jgi:hypothetical protein
MYVLNPQSGDRLLNEESRLCPQKFALLMNGYAHVQTS